MLPVLLLVFSFANSQDLNYNKCANLNGEKWELMRHIPHGISWFIGDDDLTGTTAFGPVLRGNQQNNYKSISKWSIPWNILYNDPRTVEFLFATVDCSQWMITHYVDIIDNPSKLYFMQQRFIHNNSQTNVPRCSKWLYNSPTHPAISIGDWGDKPMYVENNWSGRYNPVGGRNVWIRYNPNYNDANKVSCPFVSTTTLLPITTTTKRPTTKQPTQSPTAKPTPKPTQKPTVLPIFLQYAADYTACATLNGKSWELMRHIPHGTSWFVGDDNLVGSTSFGSVLRGDQHNNYGSSVGKWSIPWNNIYSDPRTVEFLFATPDCKTWLITHYVDIVDKPYKAYISEKRYIHDNSKTNGPRCSKWYLNHATHPAISMGDWATNGHMPMYVENNWNGRYNPVGGRNVWIRYNPNYNDANKKTCPISNIVISTGSPTHSPTPKTTSTIRRLQNGEHKN